MKKGILLSLFLFFAMVLFACESVTSTQSTTSGLLTTTINFTTSSSITTTSEATTSQSTTQLITTTETPYIYDPLEVADYVLEEERLSFKFFWEVVNGDIDSPGYGLIADRVNVDTMQKADASIASVGFGLASIPAGIENDWIGYQEGYDRVLNTLITLEGMQRTHGFYYHFVGMSSGFRSGYSEVSIIDTAILICGAIVAGEYFGGEIRDKVDAIYQAIEWDWYYDPVWNMFYMGYSPESGFGGHWDMANEQLMLYFLAAASDEHSVGKIAYDVMKNHSQLKSYGTSDLFYVSYPGPLFIYQYSHAFFDFNSYEDEDGVNWFENSVNASIAAYDYAQDMSKRYKSLNATSWGMTASDGPDGYRAYGNLPAAGTIYVDGTLGPSGAIGSIAFVPDLTIPTMEYYANIALLQSRYGFRDSFHLGIEELAPVNTIMPQEPIPTNGWYSTDVIGIDKGVTVLMIENYRSSLIWYYFMQSDIAQKGMTELGFTEVN